MLLVHGFAGAITTYYTLKNNSKLKMSQLVLNVLWFIGIVGGIFPDFDILFIFVDKNIEHRKLLTHSLVPYLVFFVLINLIIYFTRFKKDTKNLLLISNVVFFMGVCSHLLIDFFVGGLGLFSPITNYYFGYNLPFSAKSPEWQITYFSSLYMVAETLVALWYFNIRKNIKSFVGRWFPIFLFAVAISATLVLMFN